MGSRLRRAAWLLLLAALAGARSSAAHAEQQPPPSHSQELADAAASISVPVELLSAAARRAQRDPAALAELLRNDRSATLSNSGAVIYGCNLHPHGHPQGAGELQAPAPAAPVADAGVQALWDEQDLSKVFQLHSRPGSLRTIFLAFNGCETKDTLGWNEFYKTDKITTPPYDADGNEGLSDDERRHIITIHAGVAEAYASWDVDVTTEDPGFDAIERSHEGDDRYGIRMCVGGLPNWVGHDIGGIATLGSFGWVNKPGGDIFRDSFVFASNLKNLDGSLNLAWIWKSIVHEIGHTLGLQHKGVIASDGTRQEYYRVPPYSSLWGPIMGVPGNMLYASWVKDAYPPGLTPSNRDDELAIISRGLNPLAPAPGASFAAPRVLCVHTGCAAARGHAPGWLKTTATGLVGAGARRAWFQFTAREAASFRIQLTVHPNHRFSYPFDGGNVHYTWRMSNLRPALKFYETAVAVAPAEEVDPWTWMQDWTVQLPRAGTYHFVVEPTAEVSSAGATLPSSYGVIGTFQLRMQWPGA